MFFSLLFLKQFKYLHLNPVSLPFPPRLFPPFSTHQKELFLCYQTTVSKESSRVMLPAIKALVGSANRVTHVHVPPSSGFQERKMKEFQNFPGCQMGNTIIMRILPFWKRTLCSKHRLPLALTFQLLIRWRRGGDCDPF